MAELYRVILTQEALLNLQEIAGYIRRQSPQAAPEVATTLLNAIDSLEQMPERFRRVGKSRKRGSEIHALVVAPFIVYYRINTKAMAVHILCVMHGARRQSRRFR